MAIVVEAYSVIVRRAAVRRVFRGNEAAFEALAPNHSGYKDDYLHRVGFLAYADAELFVTQVLLTAGLIWLHEGAPVDIALANQNTGLHHPTHWLESQSLPYDEGKVEAAWLAGTEPGRLVSHPEFTLRHYEQLSLAFSGETQRMRRGHESIGSAAQVADLETGEAPHFFAATTQKMLELPHVRLAASVLPRKHRLFPMAVSLTLSALQGGRGTDPSPREPESASLGWSDLIGKLVVTLVVSGKIRRAIENAKDALRSHPTREFVVLNLALQLHAAGRDDEAIDALNIFLKENPEYEAASRLRTSIRVDRELTSSLPRNPLN